LIWSKRRWRSARLRMMFSSAKMVWNNSSIVAWISPLWRVISMDGSSSASSLVWTRVLIST